MSQAARKARMASVQQQALSPGGARCRHNRGHKGRRAGQRRGPLWALDGRADAMAAGIIERVLLNNLAIVLLQQGFEVHVAVGATALRLCADGSAPIGWPRLGLGLGPRGKRRQRRRLHAHRHALARRRSRRQSRRGHGLPHGPGGGQLVQQAARRPRGRKGPPLCRPPRQRGNGRCNVGRRLQGAQGASLLLLHGGRGGLGRVAHLLEFVVVCSQKHCDFILLVGRPRPAAHPPAAPRPLAAGRARARLVLRVLRGVEHVQAHGQPARHALCHLPACRSRRADAACRRVLVRADAARRPNHLERRVPGHLARGRPDQLAAGGRGRWCCVQAHAGCAAPGTADLAAQRDHIGREQWLGGVADALVRGVQA
eukprot:m.7508 g.7508  ORF g.7508 m.7508 type:complete len:370 (+) comp2198_c0_seq1:1232-2341(+)